MMKYLRALSLPCLLLALGACGGGSGSATVNSGVAVGTVNVVVDTAAGSDAVIQFQIAAAVLVTADGVQTGNVLREATMLTVADPSGEASGLVLRDVPGGEYASLHLMVVPGSGAALLPDGSIATVACAIDLAVPIADGLSQPSAGNSWLVLGHDASPPAIPSTGVAWTPSLAARSDGGAIDLGGLQVAAVHAVTLSATLPAWNDNLLEVGFADDCAFADDDVDPSAEHHGGVDDFLSTTSRDDHFFVRGDLHRDGTFHARHARRHRGNDGPRLIGRILELRSADSSFVFEVQAEVSRGELRLFAQHQSVRVLADQARMHRSDHQLALTFADLQVGDLAKVQWSSRTQVPGSLDEVVAEEIEVPSGVEPLHPEWQGLVQSVDLANRTIVVVPRGDDAIVIDGVAVVQVEVTVDSETVIERRERHGSGTSPIPLDQIVVGTDRIWWHGEVTGPHAVAANWVRVREE